MRVLISVQELAARLSRGERTVLLDVRWSLARPDGRSAHEEGHVPGAVYVDLDRELAAPASAIGGRHPLPAVDTLQASARSWGIRAGDTVVAYDDSGGLAAARAWWLLRWAGLDDVLLLDGGLAAWRAEGNDVETGPVDPLPGDVELGSGHMPTLDAVTAAAAAHDGLLLDARAAERYRGEVEPIDPRAGHIPGARSAPTTENLGDDGRFLSPARLRARFDALGAAAGSRVGVYCGSGVTAAHQVAALAVAGIDAALYPGSWSEWCADPRRPVATGAEP